MYYQIILLEFSKHIYVAMEKNYNGESHSEMKKEGSQVLRLNRLL